MSRAKRGVNTIGCQDQNRAPTTWGVRSKTGCSKNGVSWAPFIARFPDVTLTQSTITRRAGGAAAAQACWQAHYGRVVLGVRRRLGRLDQSAVVRLGQRCSVVGGHHLARLHPSVSLARATTGTPGHPKCIPARTTIGTPGHPSVSLSLARKCIPSPGRHRYAHRYAWASEVFP